MGRGRQKAKQTRVARELKYHSSSMDVSALQRELAGEPVNPPVLDDDEDEEEDSFAPYEDADDDEPTGYASQWGRR
jgi:hypothetical protein